MPDIERLKAEAEELKAKATLALIPLTSIGIPNNILENVMMTAMKYGEALLILKAAEKELEN